MTKRITQKDIAKALNIGYITVQRALNGSGYVSKNLRRKIFAYAKEVGYRPHKAAQALVRNRISRIALFSMTTPVYFWDEVQRGIDLAQSQLSDFNYYIDYCRIPPERTDIFLEKLKDAKRNRVNAIAIVYSHQFDMAKIISWLKASEIPFIMFLADSPSNERLCYVGPDYDGQGALAADFFGTMLRGKGFIGIIQFVLSGNQSNGGDIATIGRQNGFLNRLQSRFPGINYGIQYIFDLSDSFEIGLKTIEAFLESHHQQLDGLYFNHSEHWALIKTLQNHNLKRSFPIITFDLYPEMEQYIVDEYITGTIYQNPVFQSYYTVMLLRKYLETGKLPEEDRIFIPHELIMSSNVDVYRNHVLTSILDVG